MMHLQEGPVPLYHQLEQSLRARVHGAEFGPGDALPSEERICEEYGVSRITVRRALDALIAQGLIVKRRGVGSFVADRPSGSRSISLRGSLDEFLSSAGSLETQQISLQHAVRNPEAAAVLKLPAEALLTRVELVSRVDGEPAAYLEIYFTVEVGRQLNTSDFEMSGVPIIRAVERRLNLRVARAHQNIRSSIAGERAAPHLGLQPGDPVLFVTRAYFLPNGQPIEAVFARYHAGRYSFDIEFNADSRLR
jgi:GntR family transcriptional regulator